MNRFALWIVLCFALLFALPASPALAQGGEAVTFTPFTDHNMGFSGLAPDGWTRVGAGTYRRMSSAEDAVLLVQQSALGFPRDMVATVLAQQVGASALPEDSTTLETAALTWELYRLNVEASQLGPLVMDLALASIDNPLGTYVVGMLAPEGERDALFEEVFGPVLEAFDPFSLNWGREDGPAPIEEGFQPAQLRPEVLGVRPHDPTAYTQGLLLHNGSLYESAGLYGESTLREVNPETGEVIRSVPVDEAYFAEGLALVDDRLIQLTWKEGTAFVYDLNTFEQVDSYTYEGEGWGLCYDGQSLYMSNGSAFITLRDPQTFQVIDRGLVTYQGQPVEGLNELECVGDYLYANIYTLDYIVQIDKTNGNVVALIDAADLLDSEQRAALQSGEVLNGIVYLPESETFLLTGKHWPSMFEVRFVEGEPAE